MKKRYVVRISPKAEQRFTVGKEYELSDYRIVDDTGKITKPYLGNDEYWKVVEKSESDELESTSIKETTDNIDRVLIENKEKSMKCVKVEKVIQINGKNAKEYTQNEVLALISQEQSTIKNIEEMGLTSISLLNILRDHRDNIDLLVLCLDEAKKE